MTLAKTIKKLFPTDNDVGINLVLTDDDRPDLGVGVQVVIDRNFTENFVKDTGMTNDVRDKIGNKAQEAIDAYKSQRAIYKAAAFDTAVSQIDNALEL